MTTRYFYTRLISYIVLLIFLSGLDVFLFLNNYSDLLIILVSFGIILFGVKIILNFDKLRQKITYFFNAVENDDSTLYYSETTQNKPIRELHKSLNRVNKLIKDVKLSNIEKEQYFSVILEQVATGIVVVDAGGNILQANTAAKLLLKYNTLTHIVQLKRVNDKLYQAFSLLTEGKNNLVEFTHNNTMAQLSLRATKLELRNDKLTIVAIQDIRNELENKEVETWIKLIRVLTHEIMNSITPITSLSDTLMGYYTNSDVEISAKTKENTRKGLEVIKERGEGLITFVNSYRKLTRISAPALKSIELQPFIEHIVLLLSSEAATFMNFETKITPTDLVLQADETQLSQVLINLIKNSIQAVQNVEQPIVKITAQKVKNQILIIVEDNGIGMSAELCEQIFIPFFTTKENGSGIGLSISRQIMRNHGGNIKVVSKPQHGSKFILEFSNNIGQIQT